MSTQQITVSAATKESKFFDNEVIWGVKVGNSWMDLHTANKPAKGAVFTVETWTVENKGRTYVHARPVAGQQPAPTQQPAAGERKSEWKEQSRPATSTTTNRATPYTHSFDEYAAVARKAHGFALELEPGEGGARARTALVSTFLIAFGDGKLALPVEDEWGDVPSSSKPAIYEKCAGHVHLEKTIWAYFERTNGTADDAVGMLYEVSGKKDVQELTEKEAIAARLKAEKIIDEKTDYKALLTEAVKVDFKKRGLDFASKDAAITEKKRSLLASLGMTGPYKDWTNMQAKAGLEKFNDPDHVPY